MPCQEWYPVAAKALELLSIRLKGKAKGQDLPKASGAKLEVLCRRITLQTNGCQQTEWIAAELHVASRNGFFLS